MARNVTTKSTFSTSTGASTVAGFANPATKVTALVHSTGSTGTVVWRIQGALGEGDFQNLNAAATTSTGVSIISSTAGHVVDQARVNISANNSTAGGTIWIAGV